MHEKCSKLKVNIWLEVGLSIITWDWNSSVCTFLINDKPMCVWTWYIFRVAEPMLWGRSDLQELYKSLKIIYLIVQECQIMKTYAGKSLKTGGADKKQTYVRSLLNAMMVSKNLLRKSNMTLIEDLIKQWLHCCFINVISLIHSMH